MPNTDRDDMFSIDEGCLCPDGDRFAYMLMLDGLIRPDQQDRFARAIQDEIDRAYGIGIGPIMAQEVSD